MLSLIGRYGYLIVFLGVTLESVGLPLPGETVLITAGALAHRGSLTLWETMVVGSLGAVMGGQAGYCVGRFGGRPFVLRWGRYTFVTPERLARAETFFERHGGKAVFFGRFITGLRVIGALVAGTSRMPWGRFTLYSALGGLVWATAAVALGYFLWASIGLVEHWIGRVSLLLAAALVLVVILRQSYRRAMRTRTNENPKERPPDPDKRTSRANPKLITPVGVAAGDQAKGYRRRCLAQARDTIGRSTDVNWRRALRGVLMVASIGLTLHLVLPQIPGLERSLRLIVDTSHLLVGAAFVAEVLSELCYAELLGRSVETIARLGFSSRARRRRGIERWFMLRLTVTGYGVAHVFPGGGAVAASLTYRVLRRRGLDPEKVGLALAAVSVLVYGALAVLLAGSLAYMLVMGDLGPVPTASSFLLLVLTLGGALFAYATYRRPTLAKSVARSVVRLIGRSLPGRRFRSVLEKTETRSAEFVSQLGGEFRAAHRQMTGRPRKTLILSALGFGYWAFDALCLILMFEAMGVPASPLVLLVAYGVATAIATMPLTPGGIGVFETTMLATLVLLGVGSEAAIPILGYRLFNFWLPIPLAAIFYPTLRYGAGARSSTR